MIRITKRLQLFIIFNLLSVLFFSNTYAEQMSAIDLSSGAPVTGLSASSGNWLHYRINVPTGASDLVMSISGGSGDADLYTRFGSESTSDAYNCRPYESGNEEECIVPNPQTGDYYISVYAYSSYSNVTLEASYTGGSSGPQELTDGKPVTVSASQGDWVHYFIDVPADVNNLVMSITGGSGDADLYTRFESQPSSGAYDCRSHESGNEEECSVANTQAGDYYISIYAYSSFSGVTLTASYQSGGSGEKTFIITAVSDDLDNQDMYDMENGLVGLGYKKSLENTDVYSSELTDYLGQDITTLYHTGHGDDGTVVTSDSSISAYSTTLRAEHTFFATCLTLTDTSWKDSFSENAKTLMGYTKVSYDHTDETVVQNMIEELGNGNSYQVSWYLANAGISTLNDRWAEYVREGSSIVEYSARTSNTPTVTTEQLVKVGSSGRLTVSKELQASKETFSLMFSIGAAIQGAEVSTYANLSGFSELNGTTLNEQQAIDKAEAWLKSNGGIPADAVPAGSIPIYRKIDDNTAKTIVGYTVLFNRRFNDLIIKGNRIEDHIAVLVGNEVVATSRYWPELGEPVATSFMQKDYLSVSEAIQLAAEQIVDTVKGNQAINLVGAEAVYGTFGPAESGNQLVPAFLLKSDDGTSFVINAITGDLVL